jgi:hypothetical protein
VKKKSRQLSESNVFLRKGVAELIFDIPDNTYGIDVSAHYFKSEANFKISRALSNSKEYIYIEPSKLG